MSKKHKHEAIFEFPVPYNPGRAKQFCRCGYLRYVQGTDLEPARREYTSWHQAETIDEINEYLTEMALARDRH